MVTMIIELDQLSEHLIVVGGGYIVLEFGQMFHRFGSKDTIVNRGQQLLPKEDEDEASEVAKVLTNEGLTIIFKENCYAYSS